MHYVTKLSQGHYVYVLQLSQQTSGFQQGRGVERLYPPEGIRQSGDTSGCHNLGGAAAGIQWVQVENVVNIL